MMKKVISILLLTVLTVTLFVACSQKKTDEVTDGVASSYTDYIDSGKTFATQIGDVYGNVAEEIFKTRQVQEFTIAPDMLEAVRLGKVDAAILDDAYVKQIEDSGQYPDLDFLPVPEEIFVNLVSNAFHTEELRDKFNEWFETITKDGIFDEIYDRWIGVSLPDEKDIPRFELTGENGTLRVCDTGNFPPFSYVDSSNRPVGFDEEIVSRFAEYLGMDIEHNMMAYDAIIPYVLSGKADMSACSFTVTDERAEGVIFGTTYAKAKAVLVIQKKGASAIVRDKSDNSAVVRDYTAFSGKDIAVITGTLTVNTTEKIGGNPVEYNDSAAAEEVVRQGRVAGYMNALTSVQAMAAQMDGLEVIPVPKEIFSEQIGGISHDQDIIDRFNIFLAVVEADGTLRDMENRWFSDRLDLDAPTPLIENSDANGILEVAICSDSIPYVYSSSDGQYSGFNVELALRFGAYEGMSVKFSDMEFGELIPYIVSKEADIALANIAITEERKQSVLFTEAFFEEQHGILALKEGTEALARNTDELDHTDFVGKTIGVTTGTIWDDIMEKQVGAIPAYYTELSAGIEDVRKGRLDGFAADYSAAVTFVATEGDGNLISVEVPAEIFSAPMGAVSMSQDWVDRFNVFLAELTADGTLTEMHNRWLDTVPDLDASMPDIPLTGTNGTLKVATTGDTLCFSYVGANGELKGFSIELIKRFAAYEGMDIEFASMNFDGMLPYIISGKADFAISNISITEERKKSVLFTAPIYYDRVGIIALKPVSSAITRDYTSLSDKKIGVATGTFYDKIVEEKLDSSPIYYQADTAALEDVRNGRIDGVMYDYSTAIAVQNQPGNDVFELIIIPKALHEGPMGAISADQELLDRFNEFLADIEADGTLEDMKRRWIEENPGSDSPMPDISLTGENGTITVATSGLVLPFSYIGADSELKGFCIELAMRFAEHEGKTVEFATTSFDGFINYVMSGKAEIGIDAVAITEERKQSVLFSDPYYYDQVGVMVRKHMDTGVNYSDFIGKEFVTSEKETSNAIIAWLKTGIERNLITDNRWKMIVDGLGVTMTIAVSAQIFGTAFGCFICWLLMRRNRFVRWIGDLYCGLIYGTPIVVLLMITYYIIFGYTSISNVLVAIAAFTMITGASVALNLKGAIETVDAVEIEAARSIGFTAFKAFKTITLPQAIKRVLPGYTNGFVELVKATAIVGYIAIQDLTRAGDIIRSRTYDAYFPLLFVAIIYLIVTTICAQFFKFIVKKANKGGAA